MYTTITDARTALLNSGLIDMIDESQLDQAVELVYQLELDLRSTDVGVAGAAARALLEGLQMDPSDCGL